MAVLRLSKVVAVHAPDVYQLDTAKVGGLIKSTLRELRDEGGFLVWLPFGGWQVTVCTGGQRATAKALAGCHARALEEAPAMIAERRSAMEGGK